MTEDAIWNFFKQTGSIETFLEYTKLKDMKNSDEGNNDHRDDN